MSGRRSNRNVLPLVLIIAGGLILLCSLPSWFWLSAVGILLIIAGVLLLHKRW